MDIRKDDLSSAATQELLRLHLAGMHASSPPGHVFALDLSGLQAPNVTVWTAWSSEKICGMAALKQLDAASGEVKSMRTTQIICAEVSARLCWSTSSRRPAPAVSAG
jgi:putative acetyltransferase